MLEIHCKYITVNIILYIQSTTRGALDSLIATFYHNIEMLKLRKKVRWHIDINPMD